MFINMNYVAETGVTITYWQVTAFSIDFQSRRAEVAVGGWLSEEGYQMGQKPCFFYQQEFSDRMVEAVTDEYNNPPMATKDAKAYWKQRETHSRAVQFLFDENSNACEFYDSLLLLPFFQNGKLVTESSFQED